MKIEPAFKRTWLSKIQSSRSWKSGFAYGEIDRDIFEKVAGKLKKDIQAIEDEMKGSDFELSNPSLLVDHSLEIIQNLSDFWVSADFDNKRKLQEVLFPGGIVFDKQIDNYRTDNANSILQLTHSISKALSENKNGQTKRFSDLSALVVPPRLFLSKFNPRRFI